MKKGGHLMAAHYNPYWKPYLTTMKLQSNYNEFTIYYSSSLSSSSPQNLPFK